MVRGRLVYWSVAYLSLSRHCELNVYNYFNFILVIRSMTVPIIKAHHFPSLMSLSFFQQSAKQTFRAVFEACTQEMAVFVSTLYSRDGCISFHFGCYETVQNTNVVLFTQWSVSLIMLLVQVCTDRNQCYEHNTN